MSAPKSLTEFSTPIADPKGQYKGYDHPRFTQIQCHLEGTHPDVRVGQVWEDLDPRKGGRHVLVTAVNTDGTTDVVTVYVGGSGADAPMGHRSTIATHRFRVMDGGRGYRLRAAVVMLTDAGSPVNPDAVPAPKPLASMIEIEKPPAKKAVSKPKTPPTPKDTAKQEKTEQAPSTPGKADKPSNAQGKEDKKSTGSKEPASPEDGTVEGRQIAALLTGEKFATGVSTFHAYLGSSLVLAIGFDNARKFAKSVDPKTIPATGSQDFIDRMVAAARGWLKTQEPSKALVTV